MSLTPAEQKDLKDLIESKGAIRFPSMLLDWNRSDNHRMMPWKGEKDPYRIWLSEIILQQTRVEQGLKYYENFTRLFPTVEALAKAPEASIFKAWEGLGYYSRCRNLIATAKYIANDLGGKFPSTYEEILALKGVGPYTAAAIASFAFSLPQAVLDGNVFRVLSRILELQLPVDSTAGKKGFAFLATELLPTDEPAAYNQAIMDFGATVCKPVPACLVCFYQDHCPAYAHGLQDELPIKTKKLKTKNRYLNYFLLQFRDEIAIRQRVEKDIWQDLHEFPLIETTSAVNNEEALSLFETQYRLPPYRLRMKSEFRQKLSHQTIHFQLLHLIAELKPDLPNFTWNKKEEWKSFAFPRSLQQFLTAELG